MTDEREEQNENWMNLDYVTRQRTNGANPFQIFESLNDLDQEALAIKLRELTYPTFLQTAYWFAVSSTAKARARMHCQVCDSGTGIQVHHRTYATHGREHDNMIDLVVLCENCHGLFHGHRAPAVELPKIQRTRRDKTAKRGSFTLPHSANDVFIPDCDPVILTQELLDNCRANGAFTNATLNALKIHRPLRAGWVARLINTSVSLEQYRQAVEGRYTYRAKLLRA